MGQAMPIDSKMHRSARCNQGPWLQSSTLSHSFCSRKSQDLLELTGLAAERAAERCLARGYRLSISGPGMDSDR